MVGLVEKCLLDKIEQDGAVHIAREAESCQTSAIMVGGSTFVSTSHLDRAENTKRRGKGV